MKTVAVIGRGFGAAVHAPAWELAGAHVAHVTGRSGWPAAVRDPNVDVVSVATPPTAHAEVALAALAAGKAVFCEKPLAAGLADAEAMAAGRGLTGINFSYRALPPFIRFRELAAGELEVLWTTGSRLAPAPPSWKDDPRQGGALSAYGVHALDYATWMLGPARVAATEIEADENAAAVELAHESGARSRIRVSLVASERVHRVVSGEAVLENRDPRDPVRCFELSVGGTGVAIEPPELRVAEDADGRIEPLAEHARRFLRALDGGGAFSPSFADGLNAQRLLDAARRLAR